MSSNRAKGGPLRRPLCVLSLLLAALGQGGAAVAPVQSQPAQGQAPEARPAAPPKRPRRPLRPPKRWPGQGDPDVERVRQCILKRESEGHYAIEDPTGRWFGGYQFEMETSDTAARRMKRPDLVGVPASHWTKAEQDAAFYLIYDRGRGKQHWAGGRYPCFE